MNDSSRICLTPEQFERLQGLFDEALSRHGEARRVWLAQIAADDPALHRELLAFVTAHERSDTLLSSPLRLALGEDDDAARWAGARIGPWQITRRIGYGGMGTVFEAVRADDQYRKRVAVKVLHRFAAGPDAVRRFKAERQMLANLDHPNVATLLDGGVTDDGQPYLVMEYIDGAPITQWCDAQQLDLRQRIRIFLQVCASVESAHRNLIVHRDLKPANILVTVDGQVKLLDFGIARLLTSADDADAAPPTLAMQRSFTPEYAAPEQVRGLTVGTPADVYSLGVVLFELLARRRPYELRTRSYPEIERVVCGSSVANAGVDEDVDAILQMALRKEPERRYGGVAQLSADLRNYLDGLPVTAQRDSALYRLRKLVARRRLESAAVAVAALSLVTGLVIALVQADRARQQSQRAEQVTAFLTTMLGAAKPDSLGKDVKVREVLDSAAQRAETLKATPALEAEIRTIIGDTYIALGEYASGETQFKRALDAQRLQTPRGSHDMVLTLSRISHAQEFDGRYEDASATLDSLNTMAVRFPFTESEELSDHLDQQGRVLTRLGHTEQAVPYLERALAELERGTPDDAALSTAYANLGMVKGELGQNEAALAFFTKSVAAARRAFGPADPLLAEKLSPYASMLDYAGRIEQAGEVYREAIEIRRKALGADHPEYAWTLNNYADHLMRQGRYAEAASFAREVLALRGKTLPDSNVIVGTTLNVLGRSLGPLGQAQEADKLLRESLALRRQYLPEGHWATTSVESMIGANLVLLKRYAEAEKILLDTEQRLLAARGEGAPVIADARQRLVMLYEAWNKPEEAARWRSKLPQGNAAAAR
ncbi:MAG: serine/threonine-protein kinase [Pseudomonadota bacterium]